MEGTRGSVKPGLSAQLRTPGLCLGLWPAWRTFGQAPGALARLADTWTGAWGSGSLGGHLDCAWGSGSLGGHLDRRLGLWLGLP